MGEAFSWVNVDKKEYLDPTDFGYGYKLIESSYKDNKVLCALKELMSTSWLDDRILFVGEYLIIPEEPRIEALKTLYDDSVINGYPGSACDAIWSDMYKNVSGLFKGAQKEVYEEIGFYLDEVKNDKENAWNQYGVDINDPYKGLFKLMGKSYDYTINHSRRMYYSFDRTEIHYEEDKVNDFDPLPLLMAECEYYHGIWAGDIIGASNTAPADYTLITHIYVDGLYEVIRIET